MAKASRYEEEFRLPIDKKDHAFGKMNKFNQMRMQKRGCDLLIKVEGKEIHVHRNVMMVGSDYFDAMFTHDMEEKQSGVVEMKDISFRIFNKCVEFIYTGDISLLFGECEELLFAANMLQLSSVCVNIVPLLQRGLNPLSFFNTKRIADKYSLSALKKVCDDYALDNFSRIVQNEEFNALEKEYVSFLITEGEIGEDVKMSVALQWIKADAEHRKGYITELTSLLHFEKLSPELGKYLAKSERLCYESASFMKTLFLTSLKDSVVEMRPPRVPVQVSSENSLVIFDKSARSLRAFNAVSGNWTQMQALHVDMNEGYYAAALVNNFIYVVLGTKKAYRIQVNGTSWENIPIMKKEHEIPHVAVCVGDVYVLGSYSVERYHTSENKWTEISCHGIQNGNRSALAVLNRLIYAIGGFLDGHCLRDVNIYSHHQCTWSPVSPMPIACLNPSATIYEDKIFVAGGQGSSKNYHFLNDFMSYAPLANAWTHLSPMIESRTYFGLCLVAEKIYAVGCENSDSIELYDIEENKWKVVKEKDDKKTIVAKATVPIYLHGK